MQRLFLILQVVLILFLTGCTDTKPGIKIDDLCCENLTEPSGIGTTTPGLSWKIRSGKNGASQKAYQVLMASDFNILNEENKQTFG